MKRKRCIIIIEDIITSMEKIERYINGLDIRQFSRNELIFDAVIRNLEIIGEASRNIPENIREKYIDIPWKRMIGLRNIVIHEYFGIDAGIIWKIISSNIPETKPKIIQMLKAEIEKTGEKHDRS